MRRKLRDPYHYITRLPVGLQGNVKIQVKEPHAYAVCSVKFSDLPEYLRSTIVLLVA